MLQRDYIMRLLQQFFEALEKLVEERDKKDGPELQLQLQSIYRAYFNHPSTFYYDQDAEYILNEMGQNYGGEIGRASCREECRIGCRSRWSPYH